MERPDGPHDDSPAVVVATNTPAPAPAAAVPTPAVPLKTAIAAVSNTAPTPLSLPATRAPASVPAVPVLTPAPAPAPLKASPMLDVLRESSSIIDAFGWVSSAVKATSTFFATLAAVLHLGVFFFAVSALLHCCALETNQLDVTCVRTWVFVALVERYTGVFKSATSSSKNPAVTGAVDIMLCMSGLLLTVAVHNMRWSSYRHDTPQRLLAPAVFTLFGLRVVNAALRTAAQCATAWLESKVPALYRSVMSSVMSLVASRA